MSRPTPGELPEIPFWDAEGSIATAHRGGDGAGLERENSSVAFRVAHARGFRWFETDVVPSDDGVLWAIHGRGMQLRPNRDLPTRTRIKHMSADEVRELRIGGEPVGEMAVHMADIPADAHWFIDPKLGESVDPLIKLLAQNRDRLDNVSVGSFSQERTRAVAEGVKEATGRTINTSLSGPMAAYALLSMAKVDTERLELRDRVLLRVLKAGGRLEDPEAMVLAAKATSATIPYRWLNHSEDLEDVAHELGLRVVTWTPNTMADIVPSVRRADGVMSDHLDVLEAAISEHSPGNTSIVR